MYASSVLAERDHSPSMHTQVRRTPIPHHFTMTDQLSSPLVGKRRLVLLLLRPPSLRVAPMSAISVCIEEPGTASTETYSSIRLDG